MSVHDASTTTTATEGTDDDGRCVRCGAPAEDVTDRAIVSGPRDPHTGWEDAAEAWERHCVRCSATWIEEAA